MDQERVNINRRIKDLVNFSRGDVKIEMIPRTEREKQIIRRRIFWISFIIAVIVILGFIFPTILTSNFEIVVTAIVTIATTFFIVHQSNRVDYHRERLESIPIFELLVCQKVNVREINIDEYYYRGSGLSALLKINNVGKGIAFNIKLFDFHNEDAPSYLEMIKIDGTKLIDIRCDLDDLKRVLLRFEFDDLFQNKYRQDFILSQSIDKVENIQIQCSIPELVQRTRRLRYIQ